MRSKFASGETLCVYSGSPRVTVPSAPMTIGRISVFFEEGEEQQEEPKEQREQREQQEGSAMRLLRLGLQRREARAHRRERGREEKSGERHHFGSAGGGKGLMSKWRLG